jgi:glycogen debranching enzyme
MRTLVAGPTHAHTNLGQQDPPIDVVHDGYSVLVTRWNGGFGQRGEEGLFDFDCRILSWWRLIVDGERPEFVSALPSKGGRWGAVLRATPPPGSDGGRALPQDAIEVVVRRRVGSGMEERILLTNHSQQARTAVITLELGATFEDVVGRPTAEQPQHGTATARWDEAACEVRFDFADEEGALKVERGLRARVTPPVQAASVDARAIRPMRSEPLPGAREVAMAIDLRVALGARGSAEVRMDYGSLVDGRWRWPRPLDNNGPDGPVSVTEAWLAAAKERGPTIHSASPALDEVLDVAARDLLELRNRDLAGDADDSWIPNAGVPSYTGVFGRDSLIAGMQALPFGPEPLAGSLRWLDETQGTREDRSTEEQPGRMLHELRRGPMADLHRIPQHRFYGAHTTSTLYPRALAEHWLWTGDRAIVERHLPAALRALEWADRDGDCDDDGFLEYSPTAPGGLKNEAWKDSSEAIRYPDGREVANPIAMVEEQAFRMAALESAAGLLVATGNDDAATPLLRRAAALRGRWHEAYWMPDEGWYAFALDWNKRQVRTIASNGAHGLATGAVPSSVACTVVRRLFEPDLFSGWGIRTLSSGHPSYNPLAYHLGSVWPFENAMFAAGLRAYGFDDEAELLVNGQLAAARYFREARLPELFGGHATEEVEVPTVYPDSNITQAWTASAMASLLATMLGLRPVVPLGLLLLVRPRLPGWLPWLTVHRLRVGTETVTLRFERAPDGTTRHEVLARTGQIEVRRTDAMPGDDGPFLDVVRALEDAAARDERVFRAVRAILRGSSDAAG